jgi:hypothetical protein
MFEFASTVTTEQLAIAVAGLGAFCFLLMILLIGALGRAGAAARTARQLEERVRALEISEGRAKMQAMYARHGRQAGQQDVKTPDIPV